jgi:hypothetical protein
MALRALSAYFFRPLHVFHATRVTSSSASTMTATMAIALPGPTSSVTFPAVPVGVALTLIPGVTVAFAPMVTDGDMVTVTAGDGVINAPPAVGTAVGDAAGTGDDDGDADGVGDGDGHGTGVPLGRGDGDGDAVGAGVGVIVGLMVMLRSVGMGRGVGIGSNGKPVGSRERLLRFRWLMPAPTSTLAMGRT